MRARRVDHLRDERGMNGAGSGTSWGWSPVTRPGWSRRRWTEEHLTHLDATWFCRITVSDDHLLPPVVLVHGLVVSGSYFRPVAAYLDDHLRLYVPDLPGFGRSISHTGIWTIRQLADGLAGWLDVHALRDAVLVSNSLGCQVLTLLAERRPDLVRALILVAPTMDPDARSVVGQMYRGLIDIPREKLSIWTVWLPDFLRAGVRRALMTLRYGIQDPQLARLANVVAPVVIVGGERDPIVPPTWVYAMAEMLPHCRRIIIPAAPHAMNYSNPRQLARIIRVTVGMSSKECL